MNSAQVSTQQLSTDLQVDQMIGNLGGKTVSLHIKRIVLTGFMGAGKSTVGRLLAAELGWKFLDLDAFLEARTGKTIAELFALHGEVHFRRLESNALVAALGGNSTVIALGGGTPEILTNRLLLEQTPGTTTVYLDAPFETLFDRCILQAIDRPVLADIAQARIRFADRRPIYRRLSRISVQTESQTPTETVISLLGLVEKIS